MWKEFTKKRLSCILFLEGAALSMSTPTLRDLREQAVLTQQEVAHQMGVTDNSVSHWELGQQRPRVANIRNLARMYGAARKRSLPRSRQQRSNRKKDGLSEK